MNKPIDRETAKAMRTLRGAGIPKDGALAKSCEDQPFDYMLRLRTGETLRYAGATRLGNGWVHLDLKCFYGQVPGQLPSKGERGIDIKLDDIVWVMDAPEGH